MNTGEVVQPTDDYLTLSAFCMNSQSVGEVQLQSADPADAPLIDPKLFSHPFDQRCCIEAVKETLEFIDSPAFAKDTVKIVAGPKSRSDSDILVRAFSTSNLVEWT